MPEGWALRPLAELFEINPGKPPADSAPASAQVQFVPMPAVDADSGAIVGASTRAFAEVRKGYTAFRDGDVILAKITPCFENGKAAVARDLVGGMGFGSSEFHVFRPEGTVLAAYLYHFLRQESFRRLAASEMTGSVGQKRVPVDHLRATVLPVPPLPEQHRIVAKVEELLAEVNAARARLAKAPALLKRFRQSVLAAACSGRLTEEWRGKHRAHDEADSLVKRAIAIRVASMPRKAPHLADDSDIEVPESWVVATGDQLTTLITSGSRGWAEHYSESGAVFIRAQDINTDTLVLDGVAHVTPPANAEGLRTRVKQQDLLVTITGANVTKAAVVSVVLPDAYVSQHVGLMRPGLPELSAWLHLWLVSPLHGRKQLLDAAYGAGKPGLSLDNLRDVVFGVPPLDEQAEIVRRVDALFKLADTIEQQVAAATARADKLTQAVLAKAFRGELVPTEAELARRDGRAFESAEQMLVGVAAVADAADVPERKSKRPRRSA